MSTKARRPRSRKYLDETVRLGYGLLPNGPEDVAVKAHIRAVDPSEVYGEEGLRALPEDLAITLVKGRSKKLCEISVSRDEGRILVRVWDEHRVRGMESGTRSVMDHIEIVAVNDLTGATPPLAQTVTVSEDRSHLPSVLKIKLELDPDEADAALEAAEEYGEIEYVISDPADGDDDLEFHLSTFPGPDREEFFIELAGTIFDSLDGDAWIEISDIDHDYVVYRFGKLVHSYLFDDDDDDDDEGDEQEPPSDIEIGVMLQELELAFMSANPKRSPAGGDAPIRSPIEEVMASSPTGAEKLSEPTVKTAMRATALLRENPSAARAEFLTLLADAHNEGDATLHSMIGHTYCSEEQWESAAECYTRAVDLKPALAAHHINLSRALAALGRHDESLARAEHAVTLDPTDDDTHVAVAMCHLASDDADGAIRAFHDALKLNPDNPQAHAPLGEIYHQRKNFRAARAHLEAAVSGGYRDVLIMAMLAQTLHELGDITGAGQTLATIADMDPGRPEIIMALALCHKERGDLTQAVTLAAELTAKHPLEKDYLLFQASILEEAGQTTAALALLEQYAAESPNGGGATELLKRITTDGHEFIPGKRHNGYRPIRPMKHRGH